MENKRSSRLPWGIVLLIVLLSVGIAFLGGRLIHNLSSRSTQGSYTVVEAGAVKKLECVNDGFVTFDGSLLLKVTSEGRTQWSYMFSSAYDFDASDAGVAAYAGKALTLIDSAGKTTYAGNMDMDILSARVGTVYAAVEVGADHNSTILIMSPTGGQVDSISLPNQTVVDYGFFYNDTLLWIMTLDANGTVPSCTINTYRPGRRQVGAIADATQIFYHCSFSSSTIHCVGENYLSEFSYTGEEDKSMRRLIYGWTLASSDDSAENPLMAFSPSGQMDGSNQIHDVRLIRGKTQRTLRMPFGCTYLYARGNSVYGFSTQGYIMHANLYSQNVNTYSLNWTYDKVYGVLDGDIAVLGTGNLICLVHLT